MHNGSLFTLGICGTTAGNSIALKLLDTLLSGIPGESKRAAFLGEVTPLDEQGAFSHPLIAPVIAAMEHAELLLMVTPIAHQTIPAHLATLIHGAEPLVDAGSLRGTVALLVGVSDSAHDDASLTLLEEFCVRARIEIAGVIFIPETFAFDEEQCTSLRTLAQHAYTQAQKSHP